MKIEKEERNKEVLLNTVAEYAGIPRWPLSIQMQGGLAYVFMFKTTLVAYEFKPAQNAWEQEDYCNLSCPRQVECG